MNGTIRELLEKMNKQLIVYMGFMILCMLLLKELKWMLKEKMVFFVLQLLEIVQIVVKRFIPLNYNAIICHLGDLQFSVLGSLFSVLDPATVNFNSLYWDPHSPKNLKGNGYTKF